MTKLFTFFLLIALTLSSCSNGSLTEPEQIGKHVFGIMKTNSTIVKQAYIDNFLSIEEIRELGKNEEVVKEEDTRNEMTSMLKEDWIGHIANDYNQIKEKGASSSIVWQDIEYLDFVYEIEYKDGIKIAEGELYFKYNGETYKVDTDAIWNGEEYRIIKIDDFSLN